MTPKGMRRLLVEYRIAKNRAAWASDRSEYREFEDVLVRVTGLAALARLENPTGNDADDWAELRELTYNTLLKFVSAMETP